MKKNDIESFLRENRPQVMEKPTFLLEVQQKMRAVDGIKAEVDKQRRFGRIALIAALVGGIVIGASAIIVAYLYPVDIKAINSGLISCIRVFLDTYRNYILLSVAFCAIALGIIAGRRTGDITL